MSKSLIRRLSIQGPVRSSVVVEVLPLLELLVEHVRVVDNDTVEEAIELLRVDPVGSFDLAIQWDCPHWDCPHTLPKATPQSEARRGSRLVQVEGIILTYPGALVEFRSRKHIGATIEILGGQGRGAVYDLFGRFRGFREW